MNAEWALTYWALSACLAAGLTLHTIRWCIDLYLVRRYGCSTCVDLRLCRSCNGDVAAARLTAVSVAADMGSG